MLLGKLEKEEKTLCSRLSDIRTKILTEKLRLAEEEYGVKIGCVVKDKDNKQYKVTAIDPSWVKPWIKGNLMKKDGEWGKAERHVYGNWEVVA